MFQELLKKLAKALDAAGFPYMLIGGQAVLLYGEPRLTKDGHVTLDADPTRFPELIKVVQELGWKILVNEPQEFVKETMILPAIDPETTIRVVFIFSFTPYERQALQRAREVKIDDVEVRFASPEDLIIHKMIAGRPRDLEDVRNILLKNPGVERDSILHWLKQFEMSMNQPFENQFKNYGKNHYQKLKNKFI